MVFFALSTVGRLCDRRMTRWRRPTASPCRHAPVIFVLPPPKQRRGSGARGVGQALGAGLGQRRVTRLDHHAQHRLGAGSTDQDAAGIGPGLRLLGFGDGDRGVFARPVDAEDPRRRPAATSPTSGGSAAASGRGAGGAKTRCLPSAVTTGAAAEIRSCPGPDNRANSSSKALAHSIDIQVRNAANLRVTGCLSWRGGC